MLGMRKGRREKGERGGSGGEGGEGRNKEGGWADKRG